MPGRSWLLSLDKYKNMLHGWARLGHLNAFHVPHFGVAVLSGGDHSIVVQPD